MVGLTGQSHTVQFILSIRTVPIPVTPLRLRNAHFGDVAQRFILALGALRLVLRIRAVGIAVTDPAVSQAEPRPGTPVTLLIATQCHGPFVQG